MKYLLKIPGAFMLLLLMALTLSCAKDSYFDIDSSGKEASPYTPGEKGRISPVVNRNVMIMISGGRNSLSGYLATDLEELENSIIPGSKYAMEDVLVIISRNGNNNAVSTPASKSGEALPRCLVKTLLRMPSVQLWMNSPRVITG